MSRRIRMYTTPDRIPLLCDEHGINKDERYCWEWYVAFSDVLPSHKSTQGCVRVRSLNHGLYRSVAVGDPIPTDKSPTATNL